MWLKLASPPSTSIQGTLYTICRVQQRLQQLNMPHQLVPPLASTAKTEPFQPVAPCPSFSKSPRKSHSAFKPETQRPCFLRRGDTPPRGCLLHGATLERLYDCVLACRVIFARARSSYAIVAVAWPSWSRRGCGCVASVVAVAAMPWTSHPPCRALDVVPWPWRSPSLCRRRVVATRR